MRRPRGGWEASARLRGLYHSKAVGVSFWECRPPPASTFRPHRPCSPTPISSASPPGVLLAPLPRAAASATYNHPQATDPALRRARAPPPPPPFPEGVLGSPAHPGSQGSSAETVRLAEDGNERASEAGYRRPFLGLCPRVADSAAPLNPTRSARGKWTGPSGLSCGRFRWTRRGFEVPRGDPDGSGPREPFRPWNWRPAAPRAPFLSRGGFLSA